MNNIWHWVIIDLIIMVSAHITMIIKGVASRIKTIFIIAYLIIMSLLVYLGSIQHYGLTSTNSYLSAMAMFALLVFIILCMVLVVSCSIDQKMKDVIIMLFPLISLPLFAHYAHQIGFLHLENQWLRGIFGLLSPIVLSLIYLKAKLTKAKKAKESSTIAFFILLTIYLLNITISMKGVIVIFSYGSFALLLIMLGFGLAKKLDRIF